MRLLFIHPTNPSVQHISAVRIWRFAEELVKRGHQVTVMCATPYKCYDVKKLNNIVRHGWHSPYLVECESYEHSTLNKNRLPKYIRKMVTGWRMLRYGGDLGKWTENVTNVAGRLSKDFKPDLVWTTFGALGAVLATRRIAYSLNCPWVLDIKDNWEFFIPFGLRHVMAKRISGWTALTANARFNQEKARRWFGDVADVIYSGVDDAFFTRNCPEIKKNSLFVINLIGGLYQQDRLEGFLSGVQKWVDNLSSEARRDVRLCYLGSDSLRFSVNTSKLLSGIETDALGYKPVAEFANHCRMASVNAYIANSETFHHKLLELLACGRPLLAFPTEGSEAWSLAHKVGGDLRTPYDTGEVAKELEALYHGRQASEATNVNIKILQTFSWAYQAKILEKVFNRVFRGNGENLIN